MTSAGSKRLSCLLEATKRGLALRYDPHGSANRCFYRCLAKFLGLSEDDVVDMLEKFMIENQVIPIENERGEVVETDLNNFFSDADFPSCGNKRPVSWHDTVKALRDEMTTHAVITASALLFRLDIMILDWEAKLTKTKPAQQLPANQMYLAYTGDHYMLLKGQLKPVTEQPRSNTVVISSDSDVSILSPPKKRRQNVKREKKTIPIISDWNWPDEEDFNPGISIFKGIKYDLSENDRTKEEKQTCLDLTSDVSSGNEQEPDIPSIKKNDENKLPKDTVTAQTKQCGHEWLESLKRCVASDSSDSSDSETKYVPARKQRKIGPLLWRKNKIEKVERVPAAINGLKVYEIQKPESGSYFSVLRDGRSWKKDSETQWKGYNKVRYSNCRGSFECQNAQCDFKKEYGVTNRSQFDKKSSDCLICGETGTYVPCSARKYIAHRARSIHVYHYGDHTCPFKPVLDQKTEDLHRKVCENPAATPSQIQSSIILSKVREHSDWSVVEQAAESVLNRKRISNEKEKIKRQNEPLGHHFEAVAHFKQYTDTRDPFYIHTLNFKGHDPSKQSFVFKMSKLKATFALNMDRTGEHPLGQEFCYFDGKVKRCSGFVSLTASVYHPVLRKLIALATMECEGENTTTVALFWKHFNDVLRKESANAQYFFNPHGWLTDMAGANMQGLKQVFGSSISDRIKTCEFHFKECRNRQARKLDETTARIFKNLCNTLLEAESPVGYEKAHENMENFISEVDTRSFLKSWFDWWHKRRNMIFRAFLSGSLQGGSKMNQAETIHASWVKRDTMNMSLLNAAQADVRDNIQLEVEYKAFLNGTAQAGRGPSIQARQRKDASAQFSRARALGVELNRDDITDEERITAYNSACSISGNANPNDRHNASVSAGPRRSSGERGTRFRSSRSKVFINRLAMAKKEKNSIKVVDSQTERNTSLSHKYSIVTSSSASYCVSIGQKHSCKCPDFAQHNEKQLCKHIIWVLLFICQLPETSELLHQILLTESEISEILGNTPAVPDEFKYVLSSNRQSRKEYVNMLLENDPRNGKPKVWVLARKEKKRGPAPRCRGCRKEQLDGELFVSVTGLYVPYEQNVVMETIFYFCPSVQCVRRIPPWINLKPPTGIISDNGSVTQAEIQKLRETGLPIIL